MNFRRCDRRLLLALWAALAAAAVAEDSVRPPTPLAVDAIVNRLMAANARRARDLRGYRGKRTYRLDYHGLFGSHHAEMQVEAVYNAPDSKSFRVVSRSGSTLLVNRVLLKLLASEQQAQQEQNRQQLEISPQNYQFTLEGMQHAPDGDFYLLDLAPRSKSPYVYRGKIWVDARDFAVARMQGEPAKNPSLWVSHTYMEYRWARFGEFWLPISNHSLTQVRMGGKADLTIDYGEYQIQVSASGDHPSPGQSLPDPSAVTADPH